MYLFVKSDTSGKVKPEKNNANPDKEEYANNTSRNNIEEIELKNLEDEKKEPPNFFETLSVLQKRVIGSSLAIMSGILYGFYGTPTFYTHQQFNKLFFFVCSKFFKFINSYF